MSRDYSTVSGIACTTAAILVLWLYLYGAQQVVRLYATTVEGERVVRSWPLVEGKGEG